MSNVDPTSQYAPIHDPVSLEGLEGILEGLIDKEPYTADQKESETAEAGATKIIDFRAPEDSRSRRLSESRRASTGDSETVGLLEPDSQGLQSVQLELLESQLAHRSAVMRTALERIKWLETQIASSEDECKSLPQLLERSVNATRYELEIRDLRAELRGLSLDLLNTQERLNLVRAHWLGQLSDWLLDQEG